MHDGWLVFVEGFEISSVSLNALDSCKGTKIRRFRSGNRDRQM